jgi:hypothetical protein
MPLAFVRACTAQLARGFLLMAHSARPYRCCPQWHLPCVCPGGRRANAPWHGARPRARAYVCCRTRKPTPPRHASPAPTVCRQHGAVPCSMRVQQQQRLALVCSVPAAQDPSSLFRSSVTGSRPPACSRRSSSPRTVRALFRSFCSCTLRQMLLISVSAVPWEEQGQRRGGRRVNALPAPF